MNTKAKLVEGLAFVFGNGALLLHIFFIAKRYIF
jgi:hypothetical protein